MKGVLLAAVAATMLAACATAETSTTGDKDKFVERHYRTGSNLPIKGDSTPEGDGVTAVSGDDYQNAKNTSSSAGAPSMPAPRPGGGR
jgi:hypothetical protein